MILILISFFFLSFVSIILGFGELQCRRGSLHCQSLSSPIQIHGRSSKCQQGFLIYHNLKFKLKYVCADSRSSPFTVVPILFKNCISYDMLVKFSLSEIRRFYLSLIKKNHFPFFKKLIIGLTRFFFLTLTHFF